MNTYQEIFSQILSSRKILLHLHPSPDGDSLGSALAMYWFLKYQKKKVTLIKGDSEPPQNFSSLPGFDQITNQNFFETDLSAYDLFISLDSADLSQISKIADISFPSGLKTIVIDHHQSNPSYGHLNLIDPSQPATCQLLYLLFKKQKVKITKNMALNLFTGIYTDSGGFKYPKTDHLTFKIASDLSAINPDFSRIIFEIENNNHPQQIYFKGLALNSIKTYFNDRVAISQISYNKLKKNNMSKNFTEKSDIANTLKSVVGWDIGISIVEVEPGICTLSLRTRNPNTFDLSLIAQATGSGGGHPAASGATIRSPLPQAKRQLIKIIQSLHPELGKP